MMRSSNSKPLGKTESINSETPVENGLPSKERLPTIQIDTVPSPPPSPSDLSPTPESNEDEEPIDESQIQIDLETEQEPEIASEDLKEFLKAYVEEILSQAMVLAEKKLQFAGLAEEDEEEELEEDQPTSFVREPEEEKEEDVDDSEIRAAAEKVVEEVISKATETVAERMEQDISSVEFPITFDDAPDDVKELASTFVKEIVGKAVAMVEEKAVPTVPFNFEDVDLMKTSGPWYIRAREALVRVLRTACFCTPRRNDS